jgi:ribosomal protein S18 acetylase RimI-like enzyme
MLRGFCGPADLQSMIGLVKDRPPDRLDDYPSIVDLQELLELAHVQAQTCLWAEAGGVVRGFAILAVYADFAHLIVEAACTAVPSLEARLIDWGVERARQGKRAGEVSVTSSCRADDLRRRALLEERGFTRQAEETLHLSRSLLKPLPAPYLPQGFSISQVRGDEQVEALVDLHRAAWGTTNMTAAYRLAMMRTPTYEAELDLVVSGPGGQLAAYCTCLIDQATNTLTGRRDGYTDPLATHPDFQRQGLAKALLLEGMRRLKMRGMDTARLGTSSQNLPMQRAAEAVGFRVVSRTLIYEKEE